MAYEDNHATSEPTQLPQNEVADHVTTIQSADDRSAVPNDILAPTSTNNHIGTSHVADDVTAVRANCVVAAYSRSSSRSSGFDEISSTVTEFSVLPVTLAHAPNDRPEMPLSEMVGDGDVKCENMSNEVEDSDSLDTVKVTGDNHANNTDNKPDSEPQQVAGDLQRESCSNPVQEDVRVEELSKQIASFSSRFSQLLEQAKAAESVKSTARSNTAESKYVRNNAYLQWLNAKTGLADTVSRTRQPITTVDDVAMTTDDAPVDKTTASSTLIGRGTYGDITDTEASVLSERNEPGSDKTETTTNCAELGDRTSDHELLTSKLNTSDQERSVLAENSMKCEAANVTLDESHVTRETVDSRRRLMSTQPDDVFTSTPTRSNFSSLPRRLLPATPTHTTQRSMSPDLLHDDTASTTPGLATRTPKLRPASSFDSVPRLMITRRRSFTVHTV